MTKKNQTWSFGIILLISCLDVLANESHCYSIQDKDRKHFCLATAKSQESFCYLIKDRDNHNLCLAQLKNQKSYCYNIKVKDLKNQCLAIF